MDDTEMNPLRVVVFGTGRLYQKNKDKINTNVEIVALCDNNPGKWGEYEDGIIVIPPEKLLQTDYDCIFIFTIHAFEIREQLNKLGIDMLKVYDPDHLGLLIEQEDTKHFESELKETDYPKDKHLETVSLFSHALSASGANVVLLRTALVYRELGYNVVVFSRTDGELREKYLEAGIDIYIFSDFLSSTEIWKEVLSSSIMAIVNTFWFYYLIQEMDEECKAKVVWWIHETFPYPAVSRTQFETCVHGLKATAVVSPTVDKITREKYNFSDSVVLPWGIPDRSQPPRVTQEKKMIFSIIGSVNYEIKGQDVFLKAIQCLTEVDRSNSEFWIVGAGELSGVEKEIACRYGCIRTMGFIEQDKIPDIYAQSDVIVCASRQEALSVVVVEAFMNEKLAIVSDAAGIVDYMVPGEDGLIFPSGDHEKLADYMHWAINHMDEARAIGQRSRRVYDKYFTMQAFKERLVQLI